MKKMFLLVGLLVLANVQAGELYRSVDSSGKVHYGDRPLMDTEDVEELKLGTEPKPDETVSYETRRAMQYFPVTLYTFPDCGDICRQGRDLLDKRGIPYTEKSLTTEQEIETFTKESGDRQMPGISIGKTWIKGFLATRWNSELDIAGYPRQAKVYRPSRPASAPAAQSAQ